MPNLVVAGRVLPVASDDCVLPACASAWSRWPYILLSLTACIVPLGGWLSTCNQPGWAGLAIMALVVNLGGWLVDSVTGCYSSRGGLMNDDRRTAVSWLYLARSAFVGADVVVCAWGIIVAATSVPCTSDGPVTRVVVLVLTSVALPAVAAGAVLMFMLWWCSRRDASGHAAPAQALVLVVTKRWSARCRSAACCCRVGSTGGDALDDVAIVMASMMEEADANGLTGSDVVTGLTLLSRAQADAERRVLPELVRLADATATGSAMAHPPPAGSSSPAVSGAAKDDSGAGWADTGAGAVPATTATTGHAIPTHPPAPPSTHTATATAPVAMTPPHLRFGTIALDFFAPDERLALDEACHYVHYAMATYGWPIYAYFHMATFCFRLPAAACLYRCNDTFGCNPPPPDYATLYSLLGMAPLQPSPPVLCCTSGGGYCGCDDVGRRALLEEGMRYSHLASDTKAAPPHGLIRAGMVPVPVSSGDDATITLPSTLASTPFHAHDILRASTHNRFMTVPWFVSLDRSRSTLVIAARGTLSPEDCITDTLLEPLWLGEDVVGRHVLEYLGAGASAGMVHRGMWRAAVNILHLLEEEGVLALMSSAFPPAGEGEGTGGGVAHARAPASTMLPSAAPLLGMVAGSSVEGAGAMPHLPPIPAPPTASASAGTNSRPPPRLRLVLTGHSLGAGVTSLLSLMLKPYAPTLHCYAISPPGCVMSADLAAMSQGWITSVVVGKDLVPRASWLSLRSLIKQAVAHVRTHPASKHAVCTDALVDCCNQFTCAGRVCRGGCMECMLQAACGVPCLPTPVAHGQGAVPGADVEAGGGSRTWPSVAPDPVAGGGVGQGLYDTDPWFAHMCHRRGLPRPPPALTPPGAAPWQAPPKGLAAFAVPMFLPGRVMHIRPLGTVPGTAGMCTSGNPAYRALWTHRDVFTAPIASIDMVRDHLPDIVLNAMHAARQRELAAHATMGAAPPSPSGLHS